MLAASVSTKLDRDNIEVMCRHQKTFVPSVEPDSFRKCPAEDGVSPRMMLEKRVIQLPCGSSRRCNAVDLIRSQTVDSVIVSDLLGGQLVFSYRFCCSRLVQR